MPCGIIIIDKPSNWTSHDVVAKLRGLLRERRIGHGGTLDPMATGVLPVFVGRATRAVSFLPGRKVYEAILQLGQTTDSQDITGTVITKSDIQPTIQQVVDTTALYLGAQRQIPPMVSAVKIGGQRLYELARQGQEVERPPRPVTFYDLQVSPLAPNTFALRVDCSGGTYVRTLCHDIGQQLGCGGVLASLRRVRSGPYTLEGALTLQQVEALEDRTSVLRPLDSLFADLPAVTISESGEKLFFNGNSYPESNYPDGDYRLYSNLGAFCALGRVTEGQMFTVKSFFEVAHAR